jgi:hypothetical protein
MQADELATMSKHRGDHIFQVYITELFKPVLRCMAGFKKSELYFVERTELEPPGNLEANIHLMAHVRHLA